jgi:hypothetical protein
MRCTAVTFRIVAANYSRRIVDPQIHTSPGYVMILECVAVLTRLALAHVEIEIFWDVGCAHRKFEIAPLVIVPTACCRMAAQTHLARWRSDIPGCCQHIDRRVRSCRGLLIAWCMADQTVNLLGREITTN